MSPKLPDLLVGLVVAMSASAPPEAGGDYAAARMGLVASLLILAAQEAERGPAARLWENDAISALLATESARAAEPEPERGKPGAVGDATWSALDERNAALRRRLIALHEGAEARGDKALQSRILALYQQMAHARRLTLPSALG